MKEEGRNERKGVKGDMRGAQIVQMRGAQIVQMRGAQIVQMRGAQIVQRIMISAEKKSNK
jgi:hypothetical protein